MEFLTNQNELTEMQIHYNLIIKKLLKLSMIRRKSQADIRQVMNIRFD